MKTKSSLFAVVLTATIVWSAFGQLKLSSRHPDEPADDTYNERFSTGNALETLKNIDGALQSFRSLTEESKGKLTKEKLAKVGNTAWDVQHLGFYNGVRVVEGTVRKQDYEIKKLEYKLAEIKYKIGEESAASLQEKRSAYR